MSPREAPDAARPGTARSVEAEIMAISRRCAALPRRTDRTPEEIIGYDEHGLPRRT
jgi:antitoxin VapB